MRWRSAHDDGDEFGAFQVVEIAPFKRAGSIAPNAKPRSMLGAGCGIISNGNEAGGGVLAFARRLFEP